MEKQPHAYAWKPFCSPAAISLAVENFLGFHSASRSITLLLPSGSFSNLKVGVWRCIPTLPAKIDNIFETTMKKCKKIGFRWFIGSKQ